MGKCLIIGQGLAGSFLALECYRQGIEFHVVDAGHPQSASRQAAGLWNPVSFKRITAHESIHEYLDALFSLFEFSRSFIGNSFFHPLELARIFPDQSYANDWDVKSENPKMSSLLAEPKAHLTGWHSPFGAGMVRNAGWIDTPLFLEIVQQWMIQKNTFSSDSFSESDIDFSDDQIIYHGESYAQLIFCTGLFPTLKQFDFLNIIPNKGHLLELNVPALSQDQIVHYGNFCIPIGNGKFRIGSTYEWEVADNNVEDSLCNQLLDLFSQHCHELPEVRRTYIGHRPTVIDRNPIIGLLPEDKRLGVFNGLGTKGILQGPYMAKLLVQHLLTAATIPKTFHVTRFLNNQRLNTSQ